MRHSTLAILKAMAAAVLLSLGSCSDEVEFRTLSPGERERRENSMAAHLKAGTEFRNNAEFEAAVDEHKMALSDAEALGDTLNIVVSMNQIGTDYRRLGVLEEASSWHYEALRINGNYSDSTSFQARKNRANAYNGLGNIMLTLEDYREAEKAFRSALAVEELLESELGQAINTSNIASIYEHEGQYDL
ncbi:MAG: tetratricopeptide repeat protein, partial [Bacteroidales bacterium]|nr:tetratricopeptide repeat protein [Bacteroidales bacterium]